jgi:hypothetical protein
VFIFLTEEGLRLAGRRCPCIFAGGYEKDSSENKRRRNQKNHNSEIEYARAGGALSGG